MVFVVFPKKTGKTRYKSRLLVSCFQIKLSTDAFANISICWRKNKEFWKNNEDWVNKWTQIISKIFFNEEQSTKYKVQRTRDKGQGTKNKVQRRVSGFKELMLIAETIVWIHWNVPLIIQTFSFDSTEFSLWFFWNAERSAFCKRGLAWFTPRARYRISEPSATS